ncbi:unnamed protein product [Mytilus coruscus]|uniref:C2H2-type domain-containing protein n=1 Tax=Mytilus coruscus TaxID=42192 RepID=A0A6J8AM64_MYTCO|nr:unnamed protein product [Mytilus coruscus]
MTVKCLSSKFNAVDCGFSNSYNDTKQFYKLNECEKNTDAHLRSLHSSCSYNLNSDVSESTLILSRVGAVFNYSCDYNICQAHRDTLDVPQAKKICLSSEVVCRLSVTDGNCLQYENCTTYICQDGAFLLHKQWSGDLSHKFCFIFCYQEDTEAMNCIGFACPEPGCQREFVSANGLERHILKGSHQYVKPAGTDVVKQMWVDKCNNIGSEYKSVIDQSVISGSEDDSVVEGWALKKTRKIVRFSPKIKIFLKNIYDEGERTGKRPYHDDLCDRLRKFNEQKMEPKCFPLMNGYLLVKLKVCLQVLHLNNIQEGISRMLYML